MAKTVNPTLLNHFQSEQTTVSTLWKMVRKDGQIYGFSDSDIDVYWNGVMYEAATGFTPSSISTTAGLNVDNLDAEGIITSDSITDDDLLAGLWDGCEVEVWRVNRADLSMGGMLMRKGTTGEVQTGRAQYRAELRGLMQPLQQMMGNIYTAPCKANLGDSKCKIDLSLHTVSGVITSSTNRRVLSDTSRTEADDTFTNGKITFTSGLNIGRSMEVKKYTLSGGVFQLHLAMPFDMAIGDTYTVSKGCGKSITLCQSNFNNVVNFRGFPHIPGKDKLMGGS